MQRDLEQQEKLLDPSETLGVKMQHYQTMGMLPLQLRRMQPLRAAVGDHPLTLDVFVECLRVWRSSQGVSRRGRAIFGRF